LIYTQTQIFPKMNDTIKELTVTKSLKLLCDGFKNDFAQHLFAEIQNTDLFEQIASEFVMENIPVIDEETQMELSMMLLETLDIVAR